MSRGTAGSTSLWSWFGRRTIGGVSPRLKRGEPEQVDRLRALSEAFRPSAPIDRRALFSGRTRQLGDLFDVADQPGQHAVVYGERGVGKTSLVSVAAEVLAAADVLTARTTCDRSDDFESVWRKALGEATSPSPARGSGSRPARDVQVTAAALLAADATPHDVRRGLQASRVHEGSPSSSTSSIA